MTQVLQIKDVEDVIAKWPRILGIAQTEADVTSEDLLQMFLQCLSEGAVFFSYGDHGLMGFCCVVERPEYLEILSLPRDNKVGMAHACLSKVYEVAKELGLSEVRITSTNMCGSAFKYFNHHLKFRRHAVIFKREL
jgi:hypothetical protein